jgi:hypothetical protein
MKTVLWNFVKVFNYNRFYFTELGAVMPYIMP